MSPDTKRQVSEAEAALSNAEERLYFLRADAILAAYLGPLHNARLAVRRSVHLMDSISESRIVNVHPKLVEHTRTIYENMTALGHRMIVVSGYRSTTEQSELYARGRTTPGHIITNARAGQSMHNYGLAIDLQPLSATNFASLDNDRTHSTPAWRDLIRLGKSEGLEWGGDWHSFPDFPHWQMPKLPANPTPAMVGTLLGIMAGTHNVATIFADYDAGEFNV